MGARFARSARRDSMPNQSPTLARRKKKGSDLHLQKRQTILVMPFFGKSNQMEKMPRKTKEIDRANSIAKVLTKLSANTTSTADTYVLHMSNKKL